MRTDRGWRRFYAIGWFVSVGITALGFRQWKVHLREVKFRANEAERTRELRETLDVLRRDDDTGGNGLDRLPGLLDRARSGRVPATMHVAGEPRALPVEGDRTAYRIVQEALTKSGCVSG
jgi:signal transduction histidine kinase